VEACADAGPDLLAAASSPFAALLEWVHLLVGFVDTEHGLAKVWRGDDAGFTALHQLVLDRLVATPAELLTAARASGEVVTDTGAYEPLRAVGDLLAWSVPDPGYDVRRIVTLLVSGRRQPPPADERGNRTHWLHTDCLADRYGVPVFGEPHGDMLGPCLPSLVRSSPGAPGRSTSPTPTAGSPCACGAGSAPGRSTRAVDAWTIPSGADAAAGRAPRLRSPLRCTSGPPGGRPRTPRPRSTAP